MLTEKVHSINFKGILPKVIDYGICSNTQVFVRVC